MDEVNGPYENKDYLVKTYIKCILTSAHDINKRQNFVRMLSRCNKSLENQELEIFEHITVLTSHHLSNIVLQLNKLRDKWI